MATVACRVFWFFLCPCPPRLKEKPAHFRHSFLGGPIPVSTGVPLFSGRKGQPFPVSGASSLIFQSRRGSLPGRVWVPPVFIVGGHS